MKYLLIIIGFMFPFFAFQIGYAEGVTVSIIMIIGMPIAIWRMSYNLELRQFGKQYENIYVVSMDHENRKIPRLPEAIEQKKGLVHFCEFKKVESTVLKIKKKLRESGNRNFETGSKDPYKQIRVIGITFRDAHAVNEDWAQYEIRVAEEIKTDRIKRNVKLKEKDSATYNRHENHQDWEDVDYSKYKK